MTAYHRVLYIYAVVQQYVLVNFTVVNLTVGPYMNRKRFLLSQSTLREELVEKKKHVLDILGLLTILVQLSLSSPVERV